MSDLVRRLQEAAQLSGSSRGGSAAASSASSPAGSSPRPCAALPGGEHELARRCLWPDGGPPLIGTLAPPGCAHDSRGSGGGVASPHAAAAAPWPPASGDGPAAAAARRWHDLPADVLGLVTTHLSLHDLKACRLACREWRAAISAHVQLLRPRELRAKEAAARCAPRCNLHAFGGGEGRGARGRGNGGAASLRCGG